MANLIDRFAETIFNRISKRISNRKEELGKIRTDITKDDNVQLLSNIMNNKRLPKRNPYLLNQSITYDIVANLNFPSSYKLIWGENDDLDHTLKELFDIGIGLLEDSSYDVVEQCYHTYLPYSREASHFNSAIEPLNPDIETVDAQKQLAKEYLYFELSDNWKRAHYSFFKDKGTKKLNKQLTIFINLTLSTLLHEFLNETNHSGEKTYDLMSSIIEYENESEFESIAHGPEWFAHQPLSYSDKPLADIRQSIIDAGEEYIDAIVNAQKETDLFFQNL